MVIETDINKRVPGFESWWDVPIAETSKIENVRAAQSLYAEAKRKERYFYPQDNESKVQTASAPSRTKRERS